jgi:hypothetical protein
LKHLAQLIPALSILIVLGFFYIVLKALAKYYQLKNRRSPFKDKFLRCPGESLRAQLEDISVDLNVYLFSSLITPLFFYSAIITQAYFGGKAISALTVWILILIAVAFEGYFIFKLVNLIGKRCKFRLGYEGELAVGQEVNQLLGKGYAVYHDFPAEKFNIDHIVVGRAGVFAVETKARQKPITGNGRADANVIYDGLKLHFPDWTETKPLEQARRQAQWLSKWLSSAVGDYINVQPVLALPGWFVERTALNGFPVINPKQFRSILKPTKARALDGSMITRIVHQIDQRCRDVHPRAGEGLGGKPGLPDLGNA